MVQILLGIVAAATGAAGGVGYIGFKGNSYTGWNKVCTAYGSFCAHFAASIFLSLISSISLLLLVLLSFYMISKKIARRWFGWYIMKIFSIYEFGVNSLWATWVRTICMIYIRMLNYLDIVCELVLEKLLVLIAWKCKEIYTISHVQKN